MSSSLRDQLIAAGLVTERQAKQAAQQARQFKQRRLPENPAKTAAQQAQAAKAARDQELARRQQEKAERKARRAQVNQMVEQVAIPKVESDDSYSFADGTTIRRIPINAELRARLSSGELAIARFRGSYALVPAEAVPRIRERDEHAVIPLDKDKDKEKSAVDPNDPYKDFVVPDDLTW